jgi:hypothetical protein
VIIFKKAMRKQHYYPLFLLNKKTGKSINLQLAYATGLKIFQLS